METVMLIVLALLAYVLGVSTGYSAGKKATENKENSEVEKNSGKAVD